MNTFDQFPEPPYFAVIMTSCLLHQVAGYEIMAEKMLELVQGQPGFLGADWAKDETDILVSYWADLESIERWKQDALHVRTKEIGRQFWYESYQVRIVEVKKQYAFRGEGNDMMASRFPEIRTERGVLKLLNVEQAPLLQEYIVAGKDFFAPWEPERHSSYYELETCRTRITQVRRDFLDDKGVALYFLSPDENRILGYTNFSNIVRGVFQACYLGYSLAESEQGKGLMHEALTAGIDYMRREQNIDRIMANYMPNNAKSAAVLQKLGFEKEGVAKNYLKIAGEWQDHVLTALVMR